MRLKAQLTPEAEGDLAEAFDYYEAQLSGLGREFLAAAVEYQLERIVENPSLYQVLHRGVRRAVVRRFPYGIFYWVEGQSVVVLALEHLARDPEHWKQRL